MNRKLHVVHLFVTVLIIFTGCQKTGDLLIKPEQGTASISDLVGCWELVSADNLFEGDLFVTCDGMGTEYAVVGREFRKQTIDFGDVDYEFVDGQLAFAGRLYKRNNRQQQVSPCNYFPDEGLIKLFLIDGNFPMTVKVGYDEECRFFTERRSVWSGAHKFERDTIWFEVTNDSISVRAFSSSSSTFLPHWFYGDVIDWVEPRFYDKRLVHDTTFVAGEFRFVEHMIYFFRGCEVTDESGLLDRICYNNLHSCYFVPEIGSVMSEHYWYMSNHGMAYGQNKVELVDYFNPLTTVEAHRARADYRHVGRAEDE